MLKTTRVRAAHIQFQQGVSKCKFWHTLLFRTILMVFDQHSPLGHDRVVSNRQHSLNRDFGGVAQGENDHFLISEAYPRRDNDHFLTVLGLGNWENGGIFISEASETENISIFCQPRPRKSEKRSYFHFRGLGSRENRHILSVLGLGRCENGHFLPSEASLAFATIIFAPPEASVGVKMVIFT